MAERLEGKVALVTGATSGIGEETARLFAAEGARVGVGGRKPEKAARVVESIKAAGGEAVFVPLEVTDPDQWDAAVAQLREAYGELHILVNNAGTNEPCMLPKVDLDEWNKILAINVTGPMLGIKACAPLMRESGGGSIVNISSLAGLLGTPGTAYTTSKFALRGLSAAAAFDYCDWSIRSNVICPGFIGGTDMTNAIDKGVMDNPIMKKFTGGGNPMAKMALSGREGRTSELAAAVLFLASDESSYVNGVEIPVDGGLYATGVYSFARDKLELMQKVMTGDVPGPMRAIVEKMRR